MKTCYPVRPVQTCSLLGSGLCSSWTNREEGKLLIEACGNTACNASWGCSLNGQRERESDTRGDRVSFSRVGLWEGFLGVKIIRIPYHFLINITKKPLLQGNRGIQRPYITKSRTTSG